jgi:hypothetical protein
MVSVINVLMKNLPPHAMKRLENKMLMVIFLHKEQAG